jgi:hypothetical protein
MKISLKTWACEGKKKNDEDILENFRPSILPTQLHFLGAK